MSGPLVSILIPTYNGERFLRPALRSALEQSYRNIEIVVGDDASTDRTPEILAATEAGDPRVRVLRHETNVGAFENPLRLLEAARGEYVKFLLHDDVLATDCVKELVRGMESSPGASMAFSRRVMIDENGRPLAGHEVPALADKPGLLDGHTLGDAMLEQCANLVGELTTVLFRRDAVESGDLWRIDGRRLDVLGDLGLWLKLLARGPAFYTPRNLSRFRLHTTQRSQAPLLIARGVRDWPRLIDWATRNGFLRDEAQQRRAFARSLQVAAARAAQLVATPDCGPALEAVHLSTARLAELTGGRPVDDDRPLRDRAHDDALLTHFGQELDVWTRTYPVALASPAPAAAEISATVQAFRDIRDARTAARFLMAVPGPALQQTVPLVEAALAEGADVDVELVPTDAPSALLGGSWLAVAPAGAEWPDERAAAVWRVLPAYTAGRERSSVTP